MLRVRSRFLSATSIAGLALAMLSACEQVATTVEANEATTVNQIQAGARVQEGQVFLFPDTLIDERGRAQNIERGTIYVKENRRDPDSNLIAVHFILAASNDPATERPPVFELPGGPAYEFDFTDDYRFDAIEMLRRSRDYIYVTQRGNQVGSYSIPKLEFDLTSPQPLDAPLSIESISQAAALGYEEALAELIDRGVDVQGYDIENIVDDVHDIRAALGYDQIALRGCSFGSQWSLSYMKRWPTTVERAFLSGVEPLDYAYDGPDDLWASFGRLASAADASGAFADRAPSGGLLQAYMDVIDRLEEAPVRVSLPNPNSDELIEVVLGPDDLRFAAPGIWRRFQGGSDSGNLAQFPRFILDMYEGDYRVLAYAALSQRSNPDSASLIWPLIDNSLGISPERDAELQANEANRFISLNDYYYALRDVEWGAPQVDTAFLEHQSTDIPVLLVSGDYDWSTPIENAVSLDRSLDVSKLVTIGGATHCPLTRREQLVQQNPELIDTFYDFIEIDFTETSAEDYFATLPERYDLDAIEFDTSTIPLFEELAATSVNR